MDNAQKKSIAAPNSPFGSAANGPPVAGWRSPEEEDLRELLVTVIAALPGLTDETFEQVMSAVQAEALSRFGHDPRWPDREGGAPTDDDEPHVSGMSDESLVREVEENLKAITKLRESMLPNGVPANDLAARDVTSFVTASTSAYERLVKFRERIINQSHLSAMERAVIAVLRDEDPALSDRLVDQMEIELGKIH